MIPSYPQGVWILWILVASTIRPPAPTDRAEPGTDPAERRAPPAGNGPGGAKDGPLCCVREGARALAGREAGEGRRRWGSAAESEDRRSRPRRITNGCGDGLTGTRAKAISVRLSWRYGSWPRSMDGPRIGWLWGMRCGVLGRSARPSEHCTRDYFSTAELAPMPGLGASRSSSWSWTRPIASPSVSSSELEFAPSQVPYPTL